MAAITFTARADPINPIPAGTGAVTQKWSSTGAATVGDILLLSIEGDQNSSTLDLSAQGFAHIPGSPFTGSASKLQILWARATSTTMPDVSIPDIGDHIYCLGSLLSGVPTDVDFFTAVSDASYTSGTSHVMPAITTTAADSRLLVIAARAFDVNGGIFSSITPGTGAPTMGESFDSGTNQGNGGGIGVFTGVATSPGSIGAGTITTSASDSVITVTIALTNTDGEGFGGSYTIEPDTTTPDEGDTVTLTVTAPDDGTLYYQITGDIDADDIDVALSGSITITSGTGTLAITLLEDGTLEGAEEFAVELYTDSGLTALVATSDTITVGDTSTTPIYSLAPDVTTANEGDTVTYTATVIGPDATVYWRVSDEGSADAGDIVGNSIGSGEVVISGGVGTFDVLIRADLNTEGPETLIIDLWSGEHGTGDLLATAGPVTIADTSTSADYDWTGTTFVFGTPVEGETGYASEGATVSVTITASPPPPDGTRLRMQVLGTVDGSDYTITGSSDWVEFDGVSGTVSWSITLDEDVTTEGPETLQIRARTGWPATDGDIIYASPTITVADTSQAAPTYAGSADPTSAGEGGSIAITVDCTTVPVPTVLYWDADGDISAADLVGGSLSGSFEIDTGDILASSGGFSLSFVEDLTTEGSEGFVVNIRTSPGGTIVETIEGLSITDTSLTPPVFSASVSVSSVPEGGEVTLSAIADWFLGDTLYITRTGTAGDADFVGGLPESLSLSETTYPRKTGSVVITVAQDALIEGPETITFELRTGSAGGPVVATAGPVTLIDEAYTVTVSRTTVKGGQAVEIEFRAVNASPSATHGYLITGTVVAEDFTDDALSGTFSLVDGVATVTKTLDAEAAAEGALFFRVQMRRTDAEGAVLATSVAVMVYSAVEDYDAFLASSEGIRVLLVEMDHADGTEYFADYPYVSLPGDSDPHRGYDPALLEAVNFESRIDGHFQAGRIAVANNHGDYDHLLDLAWRGYEIRLYLGAPGWSRDDFRLIARQINGGLDNVEPGRLSWAVHDGMAVFRQPLPRTLLADGTPVPIALGQVFNASPVLIDRVNHRYQVNDGAIVSVTPRVNGADVTSADNVGEGTFDLSSEPSGNLTADIEGTLTTAATQIGWVASLHSISVDGDTLSALPTWPLGLWYPGHVEAAAVLQMVCDSVGGFAHRNALGVVGVYRLEAPAETADLVLTADDIVAGGLRKVAEEEPIKTLTVRYKRNWAPASRDSLAGIIATDAELVDELTRDWRTVSVTNTLDDYPLAPDLTVETYLVEEADAEDYAEYKAALHAVPRQTWEVEAFLGIAEAVPGRTAQITYPEDGWESGRNARILSVRLSPTPGIVKLEVWF